MLEPQPRRRPGQQHRCQIPRTRTPVRPGDKSAKPQPLGDGHPRLVRAAQNADDLYIVVRRQVVCGREGRPDDATDARRAHDAGSAPVGGQRRRLGPGRAFDVDPGLPRPSRRGLARPRRSARPQPWLRPARALAVKRCWSMPARSSYAGRVIAVRDSRRPSRTSSIQARSRPMVVAGPWPGKTPTWSSSSVSRAERRDHRVGVAAGQVDAAPRPGEQRVAAEQDPVVLGDEADRALGVAGRVEDAQADLAERDDARPRRARRPGPTAGSRTARTSAAGSVSRSRSSGWTAISRARVARRRRRCRRCGPSDRGSRRSA